MSQTDFETVEELLAGEVLGDLTDDERTQLSRLERQMPVDVNEQRRDLEHAAASLSCVAATPQSRLPDELAQTIRQQGYQSLRKPRSLRDQVSSQTSAVSDVTVRPATKAPPKSTSASMRELIAWVACAAALLVAVGLYASSQPKDAGPITLTSTELYQDLLQREGVSQIDWSPGTTPFDNPVSGKVVWDNEKQQGIMQFVGMPINDPTAEQYQLWIIDPARDEEPIDGGVFDVTASGEVLIPIDAKLKVVSPAAFAITIEQPGGVVVSTRERLPLLAPVES